MAQPTMNAFFSVKKKNTEFQPSKRLKVQHATTTNNSSEVVPESKQIVAPVTRVSTRSRKQIQAPVEDLKVAETKPRTKSQSTSRSKRQPSKTKNQPCLENTLRVTRSSSRSTSPVGGVELSAKETIKAEDLAGLATAACDDHCVSPPTTPTKRVSSNKTSTTAGKRSRTSKVVRKDLLAQADAIQAPVDPKKSEGYDFSKFLQQGEGETKGKTKETSRKKLVMKRRSEEALNEKNKESEETTVSEIAEEETSKTKEAVKQPTRVKPNAKTNTAPSKSSKSKGDETKSKSDCVQREKQEEKKQESKPKQDILDPATMKARLAKSGKLAELQERLAQFSKAAAKVKKEKDVQRLADLKAAKEKANEAAKPKKAPAFERYHTLAAPVPPTLVLPFRYKTLLEMFHSADTVISMLYKRFELCTFSKLKNAVQVMTRRTFEEKTLGQIKKVYPEAYVVRQEKGIPIPGTGNNSSWQLTIEPNLGDIKDGDVDKEGRPTFTATKLLDRKAFFHNFLINMVKTHHKEFLSKLDRPLDVADDKITRWHPSFRVDEVPDVPPAELPKPPDVKKFTTASSVLEEARTKNTALNARVQKAMENIAKQKLKEENKSSTSSTETNSSNKDKKPAATAGIPQSLLERIRAKEAEKDVRAMIMSPEDEKRKEMLSRLPSVVNIIRTYFVTNKKPCILMEDAIVKVRDSCRSKLGPVEAEAHIELLAKLAPKWISIIQIKKGKYVKIDKNADTKMVIEKINGANKT